MRSKKKYPLMAAGLLATGVMALACGSGTASAKPQDPPGWQRIELPQQYTGVSDMAWTFCDHNNRVYLYERSVAVAAADPSCAGR